MHRHTYENDNARMCRCDQFVHSILNQEVERTFFLPVVQSGTQQWKWQTQHTVCLVTIKSRIIKHFVHILDVVFTANSI